MILTGRNIDLRTADESDAPSIFNWENDPENWLVSNTVAPYSMEQILTFLKGGQDIFEAGQQRFMIISKQGERAGCIDLFDFDIKNKRIGIGILIDRVHRRRGLAQEALDMITRYCFDELNLHCLYAEVLSENLGSKRLFEQAGFERNGMRKDWIWNGKSYLHQDFYQLVSH